MRVGAVVFEGGAGDWPVEREMAALRDAVTLDLLDALCGVAGLDAVALVTDRPGLAAAAPPGVTVELSGGAPFHFSHRLLEAVDRLRLDAVLSLGGGSAPLLRAADIERILRRLYAGAERGIVVSNNAISADVMAVAPVEALRRVAPQPDDNFLVFLLFEAGLERVVLADDPRYCFDLDTPADALLLRRCGGAGPRAAAALTRLPWDDARLRRAEERLCRPWAQVLVAGRVAPAVVAHLNARAAWRLRVFSEERGMKALGRDARGEARTVIGDLVELLGAAGACERLGRLADVAFIDSRVVFAHFGAGRRQADRFLSDLGAIGAIEDDFIRQFTRAAGEAPLPIVLGGHCLVAGGLWLYADTLLAEGRAPALRRQSREE